MNKFKALDNERKLTLTSKKLQTGADWFTLWRALT